MCFPLNDTSTTVATPFPYESYTKSTSPAGGGDSRSPTPPDSPPRPAADVWVAPATAHVFEDDRASSFCVANSRVATIDWAGSPSTTQAAQIAVRIPANASPLQIAVQVSDLVMVASKPADRGGNHAGAGVNVSSRAPVIAANVLSVRQVGFVYAAEGAMYVSERGTAWYPDMLVPVETVGTRGACPRTSAGYPCRTYTEVGASSAGTGIRFSYDRGGRQLSVVNVSIANSVGDCQSECNRLPECKGFTVVTPPPYSNPATPAAAAAAAAATCHTVNATNVVVGTSLTSSSYRVQDNAITVFPEATRSFWVDVRIPEQSGDGGSATPAGKYAGQITLIDPRSNTTVATVPVLLEVWPIAGSCIHKSAREFGKAWGFDTAIVDVAYNGARDPAVTAADFEAFMCNHHTPAEALASSWAVERPLDVVKSLLGAECNQRLFNAAFLGIDNAVPPEKITPAFIKTALDNIAPRIEALDQAGLLSSAYVYAFDEAKIEYTEALRAYFGAVKQRWPALKTLAVLPWAPSPDLPLDIWVVQYELLSIPEMQAGKLLFAAAAGKEVWGYHCVGPEDPLNLNTFLDVPPAKGRLIPWLAQSEELKGWLYWYTNWGMRHAASAVDRGVNLTVAIPELDVYGRTPYAPAIGNISNGHFSNEDGNLVYAGVKGPLSSQRLENLKMGSEDRALLGLLPYSASVAFAKRLAPGPANYSVDPQLLERLRREAALLVGVLPASAC